jgi:uncharacterized protein
VRRLALLLAAAALIRPGSALAEKPVPFLSGRVVDEANMIPADVRASLERKLASLEADTGAQVAVLTVARLDGEPLEEYSLRVASTWKLGRKGKDDGALFLIARDDRKMRIEVGYGLEDRLTDATCRRILDEAVRPYFRSGDFGKGVEACVDAIASAVRRQDLVLPGPRPGSAGGGGFAAMPLLPRLFGLGLFLLVVGIFSLVALFSTGCQSWFLYIFLMPFHLLFPMTFLTPRIGSAWFAAWVVGFPILKKLLHGTSAGKNYLAAHPGFAAFATSSGHSGGGWSSGGGFSGGGGSFGGGGASSSW